MKRIALIGNPNSGKTTIFNELTGGNQIIGNWPGVTVEKKEGKFSLDGEEIVATDLPGIYSLSAQSEDERVTLDFILQNNADLYINIIDAGNIQRNLYLTTQLLEMKVPMLIVVNRIDIAAKMNLDISLSEFERHFHLPSLAINARNPNDLMQLKDLIRSSLKSPQVSTARVEYDEDLEKAIADLENEIHCASDRCYENSRWVALKLLEKDHFALREAGFDDKSYERFKPYIERIEKIHHEEVDVMIADYRFGFIKGFYEHAVHRRADKRHVSDMIDRFVLNRFLGLPVFLAVMYLVFKFTIDIGSGFISLFDGVTEAVLTKPLAMMSDYFSFPLWLKTVLVSGVGVGIQSVMTFVPIIFSMFLLLSFLEDSGYMARAAFVMDKFMQRIGLPGKSFVPMIVGFGCSVPAIMATRTLENPKDRFVTVFLVPLMSCGARLPVYAVFAAIFFPAYGGVIVFSLYLAGIIFAIITGFLFRHAVFKGEVSHFVMELPVYNFPRIKHILIHTWNRLRMFIGSAGKVIVIGTILLSVLNSAGTDFSFGNEKNGKSMLTLFGKKASAVFEPMGIESNNWEATVAVFTGIFSKEAVVGTLSSLYSQTGEDVSPGSGDFKGMIVSAFSSVKDYFFPSSGIEDETAFFTAAKQKFTNGGFSVYAYLLFILLYFPCIAALGAVIGEIGGRGAFLSASYLTVLAWSVSVAFYQIAQGHQVFWIATAFALFVLIYFSFRLAGKMYENRPAHHRRDKKVSQHNRRCKH